MVGCEFRYYWRQIVNSQIQQLSNSARRAVQARDWAYVTACAREILNRQRTSAEGRFLLGLAEKGSDRIEKAIKAFSTAIKLDESRYDAAVELADQYMHLNRYGEAVELLEPYEPLLANSPLYLDRAATVYINVGMPEKAWPLLEKANELQPGVESLRAHLAECAVFVGKIDEAKAIYTELLEKHPNHQHNHYELSRAARATNATHVEQMKEVLDRTRLPPERNIYLYYALGKELEDLEQWDEAFEYYKMGGDAARSQADYDVQNDVALFDKVIEVCDTEWLDREAPVESGETEKTPIFIAGLPRSGTTLTERILASHSEVESAGESFFMQTMIKAVSGIHTRDKMNPAVIAAAAKKDIRRIASGYLEAIDYRLSDKPMFIEKFPENSLFLGFIAKAFPGGKIILQKRNPMDTCFAMYKQSFFRFAYSLDDLGLYYMAYDRLVRHWRELFGERLIEVEYESMVSDHENETRRLLEQLGLEFEEACLHFEKNVAASNTASTVQVREKAHTRSVRRWKRYEKQLQSLRQQLENAGIDVA